MLRFGRYFFIFTWLSCLAASAAEDVCAICGKPIDGPVYLVTDELTGDKIMVCSNCVVLPRCFRCGLPVKDGDGATLPDGRRLCARDAKTAVLDIADAQRICAGVQDDLDRLFSRFTSFPTNVDVSIIDRVDVDSEFDTVGHTFESPDVLGWMATKTNSSLVRYKIGLLLGVPATDLKATCAHELSHTWAAANVPPERHAKLGRDAEEGFCEMVAYLLMDSQNEEEQKKFILRNHYTRGQVQLFIEAERRYGFDQILDWMQYGDTPQLEAGHLDEIRDVNMPAPDAVAITNTNPATDTNTSVAAAEPAPDATPVPAPASDTINLQGILWGNPPAAVINNRTVFAGDRFKAKISGADVIFCCVEIQKNFVRIEAAGSGREIRLHLGSN